MTHPIVNRGKAIRHRKRKVWAIRNYFNRRRNRWTWKTPEGVAVFREHHKTIQDLFYTLVNTGFLVERILEPEPYPIDKMSNLERSKIPYLDKGYLKEYEIWKRIPFTIIFKTSIDTKAQE